MPADFSVLIPAGGSGTRFGGDKLQVDLNGRTVLRRSIERFLGRPDVVEVIVAVPADQLDALQREHADVTVIVGGGCRAASVRRALQASAETDFIAVHDAARPAASPKLIDRVFAAARNHGASVPGLPVTDTIKRIDSDVVTETLPRPSLVAVQTPQAMRRDWLVRAFAECPISLEQVTDDVQLLELIGLPVQVVDGEPGNLKLTRPEDLPRLQSALD